MISEQSKLVPWCCRRSGGWHRVPFSCRATFLSCFPRASGERRRRGGSTSDSHDLIIFFTLSRKGDRASVTTAQRKEEASGSTTLLHLSSSSLLSRILLFSFFLYSPYLRDLIRCRKSEDAIPKRRAVYTVGQARLPNYLLAVQWRNALRQRRVSSSFFFSSSFSINFIIRDFLAMRNSGKNSSLRTHAMLKYALHHCIKRLGKIFN